MLEVKDIHHAFPGHRPTDPDVVALQGVSFEVAEGEFFCMIGPSGCGKSTLLRLIAGLGAPTEGAILLRGKQITKTSPNVLVVWQEFALLDWRTVQGNIEFGLEVNGYERAKRREIADRLMRTVGLTQFRHHYPSELSGGMRQRVGLARALALDPEILLMDEPFGALDAQTRMIMQDEILRIWEQHRKTIVFVTHSLEEAVLLADRVAVFTCRPGVIKELITVDLPRPRPADVRASAEFARIYDHLYQLLKEEVVKALEMEYEGATSG
jgi:ABC-type nitrate/sulfonate/bicarbonate transport system ATPase subunit